MYTIDDFKVIIFVWEQRKWRERMSEKLSVDNRKIQRYGCEIYRHFFRQPYFTQTAGGYLEWMESNNLHLLPPCPSAYEKHLHNLLCLNWVFWEISKFGNLSSGLELVEI